MALDNANSGGTLDQWQNALGGPSPTEEPVSPAMEDDASVARAEESTVDGQIPLEDSKDTSPNSPESQESTEASKKPEANKSKETLDKEVIAVTDETGQKRKIEIDFSNREAIKKAFAAASGMRKFQAERDQAIQKEKAQSAELQEVRSNWQTLDNAYQNGGIEGLVDLLEGRKGAYNDHLHKAIQKRDFLKNASPDEVQAYQEKEEADKLRKEYEKLRKDNEDFKKKVTEERTQTELKETESRFNPIFDKYRFADKLGDPADEHVFDQMLWNTTIERLKPYESQGVPLTQELIDREFRAVSGILRKRISVQADKKVSRVIEQKKQEATENVQNKVRASYNNSNSDQDKLRSHMNSGDTGAIFKNWGAFKNILSSKK